MMRPLALFALPALLVAAPLLAGDPASETVHVVKAGETIGGVANRAVVPRILIIEANGLKAPYKLHAGQKLVIPRRRMHKVKAGETGFEIAYRYGVPWSAVATANGINPKLPVKPGQSLVIPTMAKLPAAVAEGPDTPAPDASASPSLTADQPVVRFAWPAPGKRTREFIPRGKPGAHDGIDIAGAEGSAARAAASGRVVFAGEDGSGRFGNLVVIDHGKGWHTAYAKLAKVTVKQGDRARAGERVGLIGHTGETPRTELHFETRKGNLPVDPELLLPKR